MPIWNGNCDRTFNRKNEEQRERGTAPEEARYAAMRAFGNPSVISEQTREVWSWDRLETLLRDARISIRTLARQPGFSAVAMLVIAVGIGATISLFTVFWSVLLKPLPFDRPEQLVRLYESSDRFPENVVAPGIYREWKRESRSFSNLAIYKDGPQYNLSNGGALPERSVQRSVLGTCSPRSVSSPASDAPSRRRTTSLPLTVPSSSVGLFGNAALAPTLPSSAAKSILMPNPTPSLA